MKAPKQNLPGQTPQWLPPDKEWLEHQVLILGKSARKLARKGYPEWKIQEWVRQSGLRDPVPVSDEADAPLRIGHGAGRRFKNVTRAWLYRHYVEQDKSVGQIAEEIGATAHLIATWLRKYDIPVRTLGERRKRHSDRMSGKGNPAWNGGTARSYQERALKQSGRPRRCEWCGARKRLQIHHRDHDRTNGDLENLTWLCGPCNRMEAQLWALQQAGRAKVDNDLDNRILIVRFTWR